MSNAIDALLVSVDVSIRDALETIDRNAIGVAFVVDDKGCMQGVVTDGDIRRALLAGRTVTDSVMQATQTRCVTLPVTASREEIMAQLDHHIRVIPLLDETNRPVDYASHYKNHRFPIMEPSLAGNEMSYVMECLRTNWISSQGKFVTQFQSAFADYIGVEHAVAVCNGTAALHLALTALEVGKGDEVIVPDLTFAASINAILHAGATPVLADVNRDTWTLDPDQVAQYITARTRAIMPVHLYGQPAEMEPLMALARAHNLYVIEDAAEALGALYHGRPAGGLGDAAAFSFFGNKLITTGEGGMVTFRNPGVAARAKVLRDHGMDPQQRYWHVDIGFNYRLTNLQAAVGVAQLERIDQIIQRKLALASQYLRHLKDIDGLQLPVERPEIRNIYWLFSVILDPDRVGMNRHELCNRLLTNGIDTRPLFFPLHVMPPYRSFAIGKEFPASNWLASNGLSLPMATTLEEDEVIHICKVIKNVLSTRSIKRQTRVG